MSKNDYDYEDYFHSIDDSYILTFEDSYGISWSLYEDYESKA